VTDLWKRIERCREEVTRYEPAHHDPRWARIQSELTRLVEAGKRHEADLGILLEEVALVLSCTQPGRVLELIMDAVIRLSRAERGFLLLQRRAGTQEIVVARNMDRARIKRPEGEISTTPRPIRSPRA